MFGGLSNQTRTFSGTANGPHTSVIIFWVVFCDMPVSLLAQVQIARKKISFYCSVDDLNIERPQQNSMAHALQFRGRHLGDLIFLFRLRRRPARELYVRQICHYCHPIPHPPRQSGVGSMEGLEGDFVVEIARRAFFRNCPNFITHSCFDEGVLHHARGLRAIRRGFRFSPYVENFGH